MGWTVSDRDWQDTIQQPAEVLSSHITGHSTEDTIPLVCFSHLRWNFVYQRPQHLLSRFARDYRVYFVEEPVNSESRTAWLDVRTEEGGVRVVVPKLPEGRTVEQTNDTLRTLLDDFFAAEGVFDPVLWYYTPMSLDFTDHLKGRVTVYDCMDELSAFKGAPPELIERERTLLEQGRSGLHRRLQPVGSQALAASPTPTPSRAASMWPTSPRRVPLWRSRRIRRTSRIPGWASTA